MYRLAIPVHTLDFTYRGGDEVTFVFLSDTHFGETGHMGFLWEKVLRDYAGKPNVYIAHGGDHCPWITTADPRWDAAALSAEGRANLGEVVTWWQQSLIEKYAPVAPQLVWLQDGNHEDAMRRHIGVNALRFAVQDLSLKAGHEIPHLPLASFVQLKFNHETGNATHYVDLFVEHGTGGATITKGGMINRILRKVGWIDVDVIVSAHVHRLFHEGLPRWTRPTRKANSNAVFQTHTDFVCTGCTVDENYGGHQGYATRKGMPPSEPGWYEMRVKLRTDQPPERSFREVRA